MTMVYVIQTTCRRRLYFILSIVATFPNCVADFPARVIGIFHWDTLSVLKSDPQWHALPKLLQRRPRRGKVIGVN